MDKEQIVAWLCKPVSHYECDDCWYSCATITCDENRRSSVCDCGADEENEMCKAAAEALQAAPSETVGTIAFDPHELVGGVRVPWTGQPNAQSASPPSGWVMVPMEPPSSIPAEFDETLFNLCRSDDYRGLYRELIKRAAPPKESAR